MHNIRGVMCMQPKRFEGHIEFKNVVFAYPTGERGYIAAC